MKKDKSCGCIVFNNGKILLVKHKKGHIGFPKGHPEGNETDVDTAIREVKEETNIDVEIISNKTYKETYCPEEGVIKDVIYFLARKVSGKDKPQEKEVAQIMWIDVEKAIDEITFEESKQVLREVLKDLD